MRDEVCVVGAGGAGLAAGQALAARGIPFRILEARDGIGGMWRHGETFAYDSLESNTSRYQTSFCCHPMTRRGRPFVHHTEFLAELVRDGRLKPQAPLEKTVTYHDPCYNARHNDVWQGARDVIESVPGTEYQELHRHGHSTFCCGAGGGRMWMEERMGKKMNIERTDEALASASQELAVGCPFCNIMLADGIQERHADEQMRVRDVAQILLESIEFHPESSAGTNGNGHSHSEGEGYEATRDPDEVTTGQPVGPGDPDTT